MQKNETRSQTYTIYQNKLKMDKRLKYKLWHHKNHRRKQEGKFQISHIAIFFANISHRTKNVKEKINKWNYIKLESFFVSKQTIIEMKRKLAVWENIFANDTSDKGLISKIYKELTRLHYRKTNNPIKKQAKDLNRHFSKEDIQRAQRHMKRCSALLAMKDAN